MEFITDISVYFSTVAALSLIGTSVTVQAQLYQSTVPNNIFSPIPGTLINLSPAYTGIIPIGGIAEGTLSNLSIPITKHSRILLVFSSSIIAGLPIVSTITGYASGGINIA